MSLERRLSDLEARVSGTDVQREIPMEVRLLLKAVERHQARENDEEPPPYTQAELEEMHRDDLAEAAGGGMVGLLRDSAGWTSSESLEILDAWEEGARQRLERVGGGEPLEVVYDDDEGEEELYEEVRQR